jgi:hypothetical protein
VQVGDLVNPVPGRIIDPGTKIGLCIYLGAIDEGDDLIHYTLLSNKGVIEVPAWHWELEVVNESR